MPQKWLKSRNLKKSFQEAQKEALLSCLAVLINVFSV